MSQHLPIVPILLPMLAALALLGLGLDERRQRQISVAATALLAGLAALLLHQAGSDEVYHYALGNWQAPFGIVLTLDRLAALMLLLTAVLALGCVTFACAGEDAQGSHFHGLFQLQLMGLNGAFLTGDLFNLFVFFEILLLASYALLMHGGGKARVAAGLHYVVLNLIGSALFLIALGVLYGATGTLNMRDMGERMAALDGDQAALATTGALLLVVVFSLKAAALPLYFWLPRTYAAAPAPVAALFTIMTKVGVYALLRVESLVFADTSASAPIQAWLWSAGLATLTLAMIGALGARDLRMLVAYLVLISVGALLVALGMGHRAGDAALLYYLLHSTLVTAALFLIAELIDRQRGQAGTRLVCGRRLNQQRLLAGLFMVAAIGVVGLPPLSGALAKLWLLQAADASHQPWLWPLLLLATLAALIALSRAGSVLFWASHQGKPGTQRVRPAQLAGVLWLLAALPLLTLFAGPVSDYADATAAQLARSETRFEAPDTLPLATAPGARP
ncbi:monovalent cation/H+ antiporter subunit D [Halomonas sp. 1513]|nr:monovalent cation/H+ antiporter subunit D [Halomonas sp. 1513]APX94887.1 monovalent cation/H+ antiporter subunit D [Halomonas sp. 1513]